MADEPLPPNFDIAIQALSELLYDPAKLQRLEKAFGNAVAYGNTVSAGAQLEASGSLDDKRKGLLDAGEDMFGSLMAFLLSHLVGHMLGVEVPADALRSSAGHPGESKIGRALASTILGGLQGPAGELQPGDDGANRFVGMLSHLTIQSWLEGILIEEFQSLHGVLHPIEAVSKLGKELISGLGLSRLARTALRPLAHTLIATPLQWKANKQYRPNLLSESMAVHQYLSGQLSRERLDEEMARQGWSAERIEAHIAEHRRYMSIDDMLFLTRESHWTLTQVLGTLRLQGYSEADAQYAVTAATVKRIAALRDDSLAAVKRAYVEREISQPDFSTYLHAIIYDDGERSTVETAMRTARELNRRRLSDSEMKEAVRRGVLAMIDYRRWLAEEGYNDRDSFVKELTFRSQLDEETKVAQHAQDAVVERAAEKARKDAEAKARKAAVDAERAAHRRGSLSTLERAVVRGLIPVSRYAEILRPEYDADTVDIMVGLIEQSRADYLDQQQRAEDARKRGAIRNVDVGALDQAVMTGVLTLDEFRGRLGQLGFNGADADLLTATLRARVDDAARAAAKRAEAETAAKRKSIDLGRFERLVVRGVRTIEQYTALLADLGFDEGSIADMVDLVQLQIADAAAAAEVRRVAALKASTHDVTLEQMRRAVLLGTATEAAFDTYLVTHGFTDAAQTVLLAELRADVADADAARQRRAAAEAASQTRVLPLSTLARAVRLGLVPIDVYDRRLQLDGYSDDDRAVEMLLLTVERDDAAAAKAKRDAPPPVPDPKGLTLGEAEKAVKAGVLTLGDYQARAFALGYAPDAVDTLVAVLSEELDVLAAAKAVRDAPPPAPSRDLSVAQYEAAVKAGAMTVADFTSNVRALGYAEDEAALLTYLLVTKLQAPPAG